MPKVDLTEPQIRMLISAAALMNAEMDDSIEDGFYTERDRSTLKRAVAKLWAPIPHNNQSVNDG